MSKYSETMAIIKGIREKTDTAVLFYSAGGKDGIALLEMLATTFPKVICYYMYLVNNCDHVQPYIDWAENHYKNVEVRKILHFQHDAFRAGGFFCDQDPRYLLPKKDPNHLRMRSIGEIEEQVRQETGVPYAFSGMKGVDGYMKRMRLLMFKKQNGTYMTKKGMVYPLAVWTNGEVLQFIKAKSLIRPLEYVKGNVSQGLAIDLDHLLFLRKNYPRDYQRCLQEFPYCEKLIFDYEHGIKTKAEMPENLQSDDIELEEE